MVQSKRSQHREKRERCCQQEQQASESSVPHSCPVPTLSPSRSDGSCANKWHKKPVPECVHWQAWLREGREDLRGMEGVLPGQDPCLEPRQGKDGAWGGRERGRERKEGNQVRNTAALSSVFCHAVALKNDCDKEEQNTL